MLGAIDPPGPTGDSCGGINAEFFRADVFTFLSNLIKVFGDTVRFDIGHTRCVIVNGPTAVDKLFRKYEPFLQKPEFLKASNRGYWGDGLTTLEPPLWHDRRRLLAPQFQPREITHRLDTVAECTTDMMARWKTEQTINLTAEIRLLTARIAALTVLGADIEGYSGPQAREEVIPVDEIYGEDFAVSATDDFDHVLQMVRPRAPRRLNVVKRLIERRIDSVCLGNDVLSKLVSAQRKSGLHLDRDAIVGEVVQMLFAGHLTIPVSLGAYWSCIAGDAKAEKQIGIEAERLDPTRSPPALTDLGRSYIMSALKEAIRLHPPAPLLYRQVAEPFALEGFSMTKGLHLWVSPQLLHHDARNFESPDAFQPQRFASGRSPKAARSVYLPFGAGPRTCIAAHQALHQMALVALLVANRFSLQPIEGDIRLTRVISRS